MLPIPRLLVVGLLGAALFAAGCGSDAKSESAAKPAATPALISAQGANGKTFRCPEDLLSELDAAKRRVGRAETGLSGLKRSIRKLKREYPEGTAPPAIAAQFNALVARHNRRVRSVNRAVDAHNRLLRDSCDPA